MGLMRHKIACDQMKSKRRSGHEAVSDRDVTAGPRFFNELAAIAGAQCRFGKLELAVE